MKLKNESCFGGNIFPNYRSNHGEIGHKGKIKCTNNILLDKFSFFFFQIEKKKIHCTIYMIIKKFNVDSNKLTVYPSN